MVVEVEKREIRVRDGKRWKGSVVVGLRRGFVVEK
jgi:hypothetical protein